MGTTDHRIWLLGDRREVGVDAAPPANVLPEGGKPLEPPVSPPRAPLLAHRAGPPLGGGWGEDRSGERQRWHTWHTSRRNSPPTTVRSPYQDSALRHGSCVPDAMIRAAWSDPRAGRC